MFTQMLGDSMTTLGNNIFALIIQSARKYVRIVLDKQTLTVMMVLLILREIVSNSQANLKFNLN